MIDLITEIGHSSSELHRDWTCFAFADLILVMAKYYQEISRMLALGEESFEDELRRIVSTCSLFLFLATTY